MTLGPRTRREIFDSLEQRLTDPDKFPGTALKRLTNFLNGSFNRAWIQAFSSGLRSVEIRATAAQLSGWVEYAGGPVTQEDLDDLGIENATPRQINRYLEDEDLDELVKILGVTRDEGAFATTTLRIFSKEDSGVVVEEGTPFGTEPDARGNFFRYTTNEEILIPADPDDDDDTEGETEDATWKEVSATASQIGEEYNVPEASIVHMPDPPSGVSSVTNVEPATGGASRETNDELRERAKQAVVESTDGGTVSGIESFVERNTGARDVFIDEFFDGNNPERPVISYPHVEVIVDGGAETEEELPDDEDSDEMTVPDAINESRPTGVEHFLVRPTNFFIATEAQLEGNGIDPERVEDALRRFYDGLQINQKLFRSRVIQTILNSDDSIENLAGLTLLIEGEQFEFRSETDSFTFDAEQDEYDVDEDPDYNRLGRVISVFDDNTEYELDVDYEVTDDGIRWLDGESPADGEEFSVRYIRNEDLDQTINFDRFQDQYDLVNPYTVIRRVVDAGGFVYEQGIDYDLTPRGIEWIEGGDSPEDGQNFTIEYVRDNPTYRVRKPDQDITLREVVVEGETIEEGVDYELTGEGFTWLNGATVPPDGEQVSVTYEFEGDLPIDLREKVVGGSVDLEIEEI